MVPDEDIILPTIKDEDIKIRILANETILEILKSELNKINMNKDKTTQNA